MSSQPPRQDQPNSAAAELDCRRKHLRVTDAEGVLSIAAMDNSAYIEAELVDESAAGVGLDCDVDCTLQPGATVTVDFFGIPVRGVVRHRTASGDGRVRVGVEWTP